jgi:glycosyltransferase involved in cell wall biosynthesis
LGVLALLFITAMPESSATPTSKTNPMVPQNSRFRWIVAQEGSRRTYSLPLAFHQIGALRLMYTDIWCRFGRGLLRRGPAGARALATRFHPQIPGDRVVSFSPHAILKKCALHFSHSRLNRDELADYYCGFGRWYAGNVRRHLQHLEMDPERDCFIGFNTNCLELMDLLKERRILAVVDQVDPARVEEEIVLQESERWPGWVDAHGPMPLSYWQRIETEWKLADLIRVPSEWSRQALVRQGVPTGKIIVAPLSIELADNQVREPVNPEGPLKILWLGSVVLRKGIAYLVEAARALRRQNVQFLLAGPLGISPRIVESFPRNIKILGRVTRDQLARYYRQAHVFVFPTLSDGFGITQLEAMAHALPVIATPNCANVVTHELDGLIIPPRDSRALADAIARLDSDRPLLRALSANTLQTVKKYKMPSGVRVIQDIITQMRGSDAVNSAAKNAGKA